MSWLLKLLLFLRSCRRLVSPAIVGTLLAMGAAVLILSGQGAEAAGTRDAGPNGAGTSPAGAHTQAARAAAPPFRITPTQGGEGSSPEHVVIQMAPGKSLPDLSAFGLRGAKPIGTRGAYVFDVAAATDQAGATGALNELRRVPGVLRAEQGAVRSACLVPNDPFYGSSSPSHGQWSLPRIGMPAAWDVQTGSPDVIVAILDTGLDKDRPDFAGRIVFPYSALDDRSDWPYWQDNAGHGTAVAGVAIAQGNDAQGMAGVAWNVQIMPVKIADHGDTYDYTLAEGIYWAVDHGADVINISFAGDLVTGVETDAVNYALARNVIVVAAAGNVTSTWRGIFFPAALPGVIAVGATEESPVNAHAFFSATGPELDLVAPGTDIWSHMVGASSWGWWSGTSFSTPLVSGVCALLRSVDPAITYSQATDILSSSADDLGPAGWDQQFGWGIVDADEAVGLAAAGATTTTTAPSTTTTTAPPSTTTTVPRFADVSADTAYAAQIEQLAALEIVEGTPDGLFHPLEDLRRQQFAKMIVLALGYPVSEADTSPFADVTHVPTELYPYHYVAVAYQRGITEGTTPGHFSPYVSLTRAQMITMVTRAAQLQEPPVQYVPPFPNFSAVHYLFARRAAAAGLLDGLQGMGPGYDFLAPASRGEACALLAELLQP